MISTSKALAILSAVAVIPTMGLAQSCRYAEISQEFSQADTVNSSGAAIEEAYAVFQQDRFYVNARDERDPADLPDPILVTREARATYGQAVSTFLRAQGRGDLAASELVGQHYIVAIEACGPEDNPTIQVQSIQLVQGDATKGETTLAQTSLDQRELEVTSREQRVAQLETELLQWRDELGAAADFIDAREAEILAREQQLVQREMELSQREAALDEREHSPAAPTESLGQSQTLQPVPTTAPLPEAGAEDDRMFRLDPVTQRYEGVPFHRTASHDYFYCNDVANNEFTDFAHFVLTEISNYHNIPVPDENLCIVKQPNENWNFGPPLVFDYYITPQQVDDLLYRDAVSSIRGVYPMTQDGVLVYQFMLQELPDLQVRACYGSNGAFLYEGLCAR